MKTTSIYKRHLKSVQGFNQQIRLPADSVFLSIKCHNHYPVTYWLVDPTKKIITYKLLILLADDVIPESIDAMSKRYLTTYQCTDTQQVYHVFGEIHKGQNIQRLEGVRE